MIRNRILSYYLDREERSIMFIELVTMKEWGEEGEYAEEEVPKVIKFLRSQKLPAFRDRTDWGKLSYKEWEDFKEENKLKIKQLLNG